jgi:hypothetical protein
MHTKITLRGLPHSGDSKGHDIAMAKEIVAFLQKHPHRLRWMKMYVSAQALFEDAEFMKEHQHFKVMLRLEAVIRKFFKPSIASSTKMHHYMIRVHLFFRDGTYLREWERKL